jgi:A/G-specific adenine glycosylase
LHAAAQKIVAEHGGRFPRDVETLQTLPGIGRYTAGAIASIAFDQRAPILEANTIRLLSRLIAYSEDPTKSAGQRLLWQTAEEVLPRQNVARFNQALMELGSLVCTPKRPRCDACPVARLCAAREAGLEEAIPRSGRKTKFVNVTEAAVVVRKNGQILLRQCPEGQRWAGLWDFVRFEIESEGPSLVRDELVAKVQQQTGIVVEPGPLFKTIRHGVTRYRIRLDCYAARYLSGKISRNNGSKLRWARPADLDGYPLSTTGRKLANFIRGA